jgi:hypothetical protein
MAFHNLATTGPFTFICDSCVVPLGSFDMDRGCTPEFSRAKVKKEGLVPRTQPKLGARAEPLPIFPPMINRRFFMTASAEIDPCDIIITPLLG